jgi:hypothetical protein
MCIGGAAVARNGSWVRSMSPAGLREVTASPPLRGRELAQPVGNKASVSQATRKEDR